MLDRLLFGTLASLAVLTLAGSVLMFVLGRWPEAFVYAIGALVLTKLARRCDDAD